MFESLFYIHTDTYRPELFRHTLFISLLLRLFGLVPSANMEEAGVMNCTAVSHQGVIEMLWPHFRVDFRVGSEVASLNSVMM